MTEAADYRIVVAATRCLSNLLKAKAALAAPRGLCCATCLRKKRSGPRSALASDLSPY